MSSRLCEKHTDICCLLDPGLNIGISYTFPLNKSNVVAPTEHKKEKTTCTVIAARRNYDFGTVHLMRGAFLEFDVHW